MIWADSIYGEASEIDVQTQVKLGAFSTCWMPGTIWCAILCVDSAHPLRLHEGHVIMTSLHRWGNQSYKGLQHMLLCIRYEPVSTLCPSWASDLCVSYGVFLSQQPVCVLWCPSWATSLCLSCCVRPEPVTCVSAVILSPQGDRISSRAISGLEIQWQGKQTSKQLPLMASALASRL